MTETLGSGLAWWPLLVVVALALVYVAASLFTWSIAGFGLLALFSLYAQVSLAAKILTWAVFLVPFAVLAVPPVRRRLISRRALGALRDSMPAMTETERETIEAGTVWWDAELFSGRPRWRQLLQSPAPRLADEERAFLDGSLETLCALLDEHEINHVRQDLPGPVWEMLKSKGFFGLSIPKEYGGKGFAPCAVAAVIMKIATRSLSTALTVMIPNAVGPAKLLLKFGTEEQKTRWLPRLADGTEIPCLALTSLEAGSDAAAMVDTGVVCLGPHGGNGEVLGVRLDFDKRYITLGPVATVLAVAFRLRDPERMLGEYEELGVTLALVPATTAGVETGLRHQPFHLGFQYGPVSGRDVFVPIDAVIGGADRAGQGWRMLVEILAEGRAVTLPALSAAAAKLAARVTGAHARIRYQFDSYIGKFEGVQEALAHIAGNAYAVDAARLVTLGAVDKGGRPAVISAIVKYQSTERCRTLLRDAMDLLGGAGVCLGPRNLLGEYLKFPVVGATLEGSNVLTRNAIIFGQGVIRCHPFLMEEVTAAAGHDASSERRFDRLFRRHMAFTASNALRTLLLGLTGGRLAATPLRATRKLRRHFRNISRLSAAFALTTEALLFSLRGQLRGRQRLSSRMADVLSQLYVASAVLKHYQDQGAHADDLPLVDWVVQDCLVHAARSFERLFENFPVRGVGRLLRRVVFPFGSSFRAPDDALERRVAGILLVPSSARDRLTAGLYLPGDSGQLGRLEAALAQVVKTTPALRKLRDAAKVDLVRGRTVLEWLESGLAAGVLSEDEADALRAAEAVRRDALQVDAF